MIKAVIFDWDGVISDTFSFQEKWFKHCCGTLGKEYPFTTDHELREICEKPYEEMYGAFGFNWEKDKPEIYRLFNKYMTETAIPPVNGIIKVLHELKKSCSLGVVSSNTEQVVKARMKKFRIQNHFSSVVLIQNKEEKLKPDPYMINICLGELNISPHEAVYVGDLVLDIKAAKNAGVLSAAVTWGYSTEERLRKYEPDFLIREPRDLLRIVDEFKV